MFPFHIIDLSHPLDSSCPTWEGDCGFSKSIVLDYPDCTSNTAFRVQSINMHAGIGTHIDAPAHCMQGGQTTESLDLNRLAAPCVVIDVTKMAHADYLLMPEDILAHEKKYGKIGYNHFVLIYTGWSQHWHTPEKYRNQLQFPSISLEATLLLLERKIVGLGIDTLSPDTSSRGYPVHQAILGAGLYLVENVANAHLLPTVGAFSLALPLPIVGGTESPMRFVGLVSS